MSDITAATSTYQLNLEDLKCSFCKNYLSCRPLYLLPDGRNVCGRRGPCFSRTTKLSALRNLILEKIVSNVSFPCKNKSYGCEDTFVFDSEADHSDKCAFKPLSCLFPSEHPCKWIGALEQLPEHLTKQHSELITKQAEFTININEDTKRRLVVSQNDTVFLFDYVYNSKSFTLRYTVAHFVSNLKNHFAKIQLSTADSDYMIQLKGVVCCSYHDLFSSDTEVVMDKLDMHNMLPLFNNANAILISVIIDILPQQRSPVVLNKNLQVNYDILNSNICHNCQYFLTVPIFENKSVFICNNCNYALNWSAVSVDCEKSCLLSLQNYPCRWNGCNVVTVGSIIDAHETACRFRMYRCQCKGCNALFRYAAAKQHFLSHYWKFFENFIKRKISLKTESNHCNLSTFVHNEFVIISYSVCDREANFSACTSSYNKDNITIKITVMHDHCKVESHFLLNMQSRTIIPFCKLPPCFKEDDVCTVIIRAN